MKEIRFDFNNLFGFSVGKAHGATQADLAAASPAAKSAARHIKRLVANEQNRIAIGLEWAMLPFQDRKEIDAIQRLGNYIAHHYDNVISLGIGGSYLGLKAAQDALCSPYYNDFERARCARPRIYFEGNNLDPDTLSALLANLDPKKTFVIVISKSGETTETRCAFQVVEKWLKKGAGPDYGRQIAAITDPKSGTLRSRVTEAQSADALAFRSLPVMKGVGGRFSELNIGLLHMATVGIDIKRVLAGARAMASRCAPEELFKNPALMYATLHTILYKKKKKPIAILMPFSERLKSTADWYVQLLAESLGKKYRRLIRVLPDGTERWGSDTRKVVNAGRTPISARGTNDLHSIQQNNIEGENNKVVTFIRVDRSKNDIRINETGDFLSGRRYMGLLAAAEEATEWALRRESRPSCTIIIPEIDAFVWGGLIFFFEMATAFEGELLQVNAFDQPGVEGYKSYMYYKLKKPGLPAQIENDIKNSPLIKKPKFII